MTDPWSETQSARVEYRKGSSQPSLPPPTWMQPRKRRRSCGCGCSFGLLILSLVGICILMGIYLFAPLRTNILLLGIDYSPPGSAVGRSDTIILTTFIPLEPYIGMLSIPRDLWVNVPGVGENRINSAHFFAEAQQEGSGSLAAMETIRLNFGVDVDFYVRIRFDGYREVVNALGGVDVDLPKPMAGYPAGRHHLTGRKALAFARHRQGSDDFFRMEQGQLIMKSIFKQMLTPQKLPRLPSVLISFTRVVDTNIPWWQWPRISMAILRAGPEGIDGRTITREMVTPYTTSQGAYVLLPDWAAINPVLLEIFGQ